MVGITRRAVLFIHSEIVKPVLGPSRPNNRESPRRAGLCPSGFPVAYGVQDAWEREPVQAVIKCYEEE